MNGEVMAIDTYPHIIEKLRGTANPRDKAGFSDLAESMDIAVSSLGNLLNPYADRNVVKVGLEQAIHIMKRKGDFSAFHLMAAELGFTAIPLYSKPDKPTAQEEMLDDVQDAAGYQAKYMQGASQEERTLQLARTIDNMIQTETIIREDEGQVYIQGQGWQRAGKRQ